MSAEQLKVNILVYNHMFKGEYQCLEEEIKIQEYKSLY